MFVFPGNPNKYGEVKYYFRCSDKKNKKSNCESKWLPVELVEEYLLKTLQDISIDKSILYSYLTSNEDINYDKLIKETQKEISKKNKDIETLTEKLILIEGPAVSIITNKINTISGEITNLNEELLLLERKKIFQDQDKINIDTLHGLIVTAVSSFDVFTVERKRIEIKSFVQEIIYNGKNDIHIKFIGGV